MFIKLNMMNLYHARMVVPFT